MATTAKASRITRIRQLWRENEWIYLFVGLLLGLLAWPFFDLVGTQFHEFLENLVPEAVGIIFTVVIIDRLDSYREHQLIKEQLMRQLHSYYNHTALQAVEELRVLGHLEDGSLVGLNLRGANLQDANLYQADLREVDFRNAKLHKADFVEANLTDAHITDEQLVTCDIMWKAIMPDGSKYDGRFNLPRDYEVATRKGFDIHNPESLAAFYDVPVEVYLAGQEWAKEHLEPLRQRALATLSK